MSRNNIHPPHLNIPDKIIYPRVIRLTIPNL
jgi:hypothetical protein